MDALSQPTVQLVLRHMHCSNIYSVAPACAHAGQAQVCLQLVKLSGGQTAHAMVPVAGSDTCAIFRSDTCAIFRPPCKCACRAGADLASICKVVRRLNYAPVKASGMSSIVGSFSKWGMMPMCIAIFGRQRGNVRM
jgi:hypothetical protein